MSNNKFIGVAMIVMAAAFVGGICVERSFASGEDIAGMSENEFRQHQVRTVERDMVRSLMLSEQRAQVRRDRKNENEISRQDKLDLIDIIKGVE